MGERRLKRLIQFALVGDPDAERAADLRVPREIGVVQVCFPYVQLRGALLLADLAQFDRLLQQVRG